MLRKKEQKNENEPMRLAKYMSNAGLASRRRSEELIAEGHVTVNGETVTTPVCLVTAGVDKVCFDGQELTLDAAAYILLNKPAGYTCTSEDTHAKRLVYELLPDNLRKLRYVGRLDRDTEGLLLFTNDGELIQALTHPSNQVEKLYVADCVGKLSKEASKAMLEGVEDEGDMLRAKSVRIRRREGEHILLELTLTEGKKREVRRLCAACGLKVERLARVALGTLKLGELPSGEWRKLTDDEVASLKALANN